MVNKFDIYKNNANAFFGVFENKHFYNSLIQRNRKIEHYEVHKKEQREPFENKYEMTSSSTKKPCLLTLLLNSSDQTFDNCVPKQNFDCNHHNVLMTQLQYLFSMFLVLLSFFILTKTLYRSSFLWQTYDFLTNFAQGKLSYNCMIGGSPFDMALCSLVNNINSIFILISSHLIESFAAIFTSRNVFDVITKLSGYVFVAEKTFRMIDPITRTIEGYMFCVDIVFYWTLTATDIIFSLTCFFLDILSILGRENETKTL